ncbi:helix-turn-helix domain-containing protein [Nocardia beijingensis]
MAVHPFAECRLDQLVPVSVVGVETALGHPEETVSSVARLLGVSRSTVYKYLPELDHPSRARARGKRLTAGKRWDAGVIRGESRVLCVMRLPSHHRRAGGPVRGVAPDGVPSPRPRQHHGSHSGCGMTAATTYSLPRTAHPHGKRAPHRVDHR